MQVFNPEKSTNLSPDNPILRYLFIPKYTQPSLYTLSCRHFRINRIRFKTLNTITTVITAITFGVAAFTCIVLLAAICFCVITLRKRTLKKESMTEQKEQGPHYEEIPLKVHIMGNFQCRTTLIISRRYCLGHVYQRANNMNCRNY